MICWHIHFACSAMHPQGTPTHCIRQDGPASAATARALLTAAPATSTPATPACRVMPPRMLQRPGPPACLAAGPQCCPGCRPPQSGAHRWGSVQQAGLSIVSGPDLQCWAMTRLQWCCSTRDDVPLNETCSLQARSADLLDSATVIPRLFKSFK